MPLFKNKRSVSAGSHMSAGSNISAGSHLSSNSSTGEDTVHLEEFLEHLNSSPSEEGCCAIS